jgi:hypothetical protein
MVKRGLTCCDAVHDAGGIPGDHLAFMQYAYILDMGLSGAEEHHANAVGDSTTQ